MNRTDNVGVDVSEIYLGIEHYYEEDLYGTLYDSRSIEMYYHRIEKEEKEDEESAEKVEDESKETYLNILTGDKIYFNKTGKTKQKIYKTREVLDVTGLYSIRDSAERLVQLIKPFVDNVQNGKDIITYFSTFVKDIDDLMEDGKPPIITIDELTKLLEGKENIYFLCYGNPFDDQSSLQCLQGFLKNNAKKDEGTNNRKKS